MPARAGIAVAGAVLGGACEACSGALGPAKLAGVNAVGSTFETPFATALELFSNASARVGCGEAFWPLAARLWYF